jgi:hypothetical protein
MDLKFIQDLHNKEFTTKESLAQRASMIIAGMTTLGGIVAFVIMNFKSVGHSIDVVFWLLTAASGISLSVTAFYLIWSFHVPPLYEIASPKEWLSYWNDLKEQAQKGEVTSAETEFTEYLLSQYAEIGDKNIDSNFKRGTRLMKSNYFFLASFVLIVMTSLTFYYNNYIPQEETRPRGGNEMFTGKDALICIPAAQVLDACGPEPRPVPVPGPVPPEPGPK